MLKTIKYFVKLLFITFKILKPSKEDVSFQQRNIQQLYLPSTFNSKDAIELSNQIYTKENTSTLTNYKLNCFLENKFSANRERKFSANRARSDNFWVNEQNESFLIKLLTRVIKEDFKNCHLTIVFDKTFSGSQLLDTILVMEIAKHIFEFDQFIAIQNVQDGKSFCAGYLFLLGHASRCCLKNYANAKKAHWNYLGRYIFVVPNIEIINEVAQTENGKKTEHIVALIPEKNRERWLIYSKQFFTTPPMKNALRENNSIFTDKFTNFKNSSLTLVTIEWKPNTFYVRNEAGEIIDYYGIDIQVVKTLAEVLNFKIVFTEPPSNEYFGKELENGTWTGLVGMISRNEADMAVTDLFNTLERSPLVDFGTPFAIVSTCFMARTTPPYPRWQSLLLPFKPDLWVSLILLLLISAITMYFIIYCNFRLNPSSAKPSFKYILIPIRAHLRQSALISKCRTRSFRVFLICLWFYCIIITTAYSSKLTAFLTVERPPKSFETIKELKETGLNVGGLGPFYDAVSQTEGNEDLKILESRFVVYNTLKELLMDVLHGKSVMLVSRQFLEYISISPVFEGQQNPKGQLRILQECFSSFATGMYLQKHSPFKRKFDDVIGKMLNGGLVRKWFLDAIVRSNQEIQKRKKMKEGIENSSESSEPKTSYKGKMVSLTISHVQGIFFILLLGYLIAFSVFIIEIRHKKI